MSTLPASFRATLRSLGFECAGFDQPSAAEMRASKLAQRTPRRPERWISQERLPHILITIGPDDPQDVTQIIHAIYRTGACDAREETRTQYKRFLITFGMSPTDANLPPFLLDPISSSPSSESPPLPVSGAAVS